MTDFLLEIFSEEIPAKMQKNAVENFASIAFEALTKAGLMISQKQVKTYIAPRRLTLYLDNFQDVQIVAAVKRIGPKIDADPKAVDGFLRATGLKNISELATIEHNKATCFLYEKPATSTNSLNVIKEALPAILQKMTAAWPKIMRYDIYDGAQNTQAKWVRPIRNILCLYDKKIVEFEFAGLKANNLTYGNFLYSSQPIEIKACEQYQNILRENFVIVDQLERRQLILNQISKITLAQNLKTTDEENSQLFDEVVGLCEFPTALVGDISQKFMSLPKEVLILTLKLNQKYFCLQDAQQNLATKFIFITNAILDEKNNAQIIAGNEKVVHARLQDAQFVVEEDLKIPLNNRLEELKTIIFHQKLGSVYEKCERIENLAELMSVWIAHCDISLVKKSAFLCKADLVTKAIAELPELQGKIGSHYAKLQHFDHRISDAIYEHYLPLGPNSQLPETPLGCALAIADKIDSIVGLFLANEKPTSSKDPYALRRAALGVIRISLAHKINLPLKVIITKSLRSYKPKILQQLLKEQELEDSKQNLFDEISKFLFERLKSFVKENKNVRADIANAVIDDYIANLHKKEYCDLFIVAQKAVALNELIKNPQNIGIIAIYKRAANVLAIEEKRDDKKYDNDPNALSFKTEHEKILYKLIKKISPEYTKLALRGDFDDAFKLLHILQDPMTRFFDNVVVNDENKRLRHNRLSLLSQIRELFTQVADFSKIEI